MLFEVDWSFVVDLQDNFVHTDLHPGNILVRQAGNAVNRAGEVADDSSTWRRLELVLLDFGLAEELTPAVRFHFISFLHMIAKGGPKGRIGSMHVCVMSAYVSGWHPSRGTDRQAMLAPGAWLCVWGCLLY